MTDECYRCEDCGSEDCDSHSEFLVNGKWILRSEYTEDMGVCDDERRICGESGNPASCHLIWSTEDRRD